MEFSLQALSPVDGRYAHLVSSLKNYFSEAAFIRYRFQIEVKWFKFLLKNQHMLLNDSNATTIDESAEKFLDDLQNDNSLSVIERVKELERVTSHDLKAIEYYVKERLLSSPHCNLADHSEWVHFGCTSEDVNNLAYACMLRDALQNELFPLMTKITSCLTQLVLETAAVPMLSRTHGQAATPTTFGKEVATYVYRLKEQLGVLKDASIVGKFNGAVGNFNAHVACFPQTDWIQLTKEFVENVIELKYQLYSTQIECHDYLCYIFDGISRFNSILLDFTVDIWIYISRDLLKLKIEENEVGSSAMPHKVNPIDFENAEGNLGISNALLQFFSNKLPRSRLQRDLSDSTVLRNIGVAFGHSVISYSSILKGIQKLRVDKKKMEDELNSNWAILAEPIQTILRSEGLSSPYETLKALTRGSEVKKEVIQHFINSLKPKVNSVVFQKLLDITPTNYVGLAEKLAKSIVENTN